MIYAIGDLHLDSTDLKPMGVFGGNWQDHDKKIKTSWLEKVKDDDLVLLPGDISWAMRFNEAIDDLKFIDELPGKKLISKGIRTEYACAEQLIIEKSFEKAAWIGGLRAVSISDDFHTCVA